MGTQIQYFSNEGRNREIKVRHGVSECAMLVIPMNAFVPLFLPQNNPVKQWLNGFMLKKN